MNGELGESESYIKFAFEKLKIRRERDIANLILMIRIYRNAELRANNATTLSDFVKANIYI